MKTKKTTRPRSAPPDFARATHTRELPDSARATRPRELRRGLAGAPPNPRREGGPTSRELPGPRASRPHIPDYGIPSDRKGILPWSHVVKRMAEAMRYWVSTVDADGRPHATPVDGLWLDDRLYFGGSTKTRRHRNLVANPAVCVHLENAMDVVILHGDAQELRAPDAALAQNLAGLSKEKYGFAPNPEDYGKEGVFVLRPHTVFAWTQFPKDATRWRL